ncbi:helix-hairpin-helix domain-containing protein [Chloroflexota bacterium]
MERHRTPAIALLVAVILAGLAIFLYRQTSLPHATEITISPPSPNIQVHIEGAVVNPGVYSLNVADRIADAVEAAGGFSDDADREAVNLAAMLSDGDRVYIHSTGEVPQKININTADVWLLDALHGIGEELAQDIIDYRTENGPFQAIEDLTSVTGIGLALFELIKDKITVR